MWEMKPISTTDKVDQLLAGAALGPRAGMIECSIDRQRAQEITDHGIKNGAFLGIQQDKDLVDLIKQNCLVESGTPIEHQFDMVLAPVGLVLRYKAITGSRLLAEPSESALTELGKRLCQDAAMPGQVVKPVAPKQTPKQVPNLEPEQEADEGSFNAPDTLLQKELKMLIPKGNVIELPKEQITLYPTIKKLMERAGGKYKKLAFHFSPETDAESLIESLVMGEEVNPAKKWQFFPTSDELAEVLTADCREGLRVLEPSAGEGVLVNAAYARGAEDIVAVEAWNIKADVLRKKGFNVVEADFLQCTVKELGLFDVVCANPPFSGGADIKHVLHMLNFLKPNGVLNAIMSPSWMTGSQRKQREFRDFLKAVDAEIVQIAPGAFKHAGTNVATVRIRLKAKNLKNASVSAAA